MKLLRWLEKRESITSTTISKASGETRKILQSTLSKDLRGGVDTLFDRYKKSLGETDNGDMVFKMILPNSPCLPQYCLVLEVCLGLRKSLGECSMRLIFYGEDAKKVGGYRYESSHRPGAHVFYHVQPISDFKTNNSSNQSEGIGTPTHGSISEKIPAIPIPARSPVPAQVESDSCLKK